MTLTQLLENNARKHPKKTAFTMRMGYRTVSLTYKEVYDTARKIACLLEKNGVSKGDKILLLAPNSPYWISVFWGALLRGVCVVPLNLQMTPEMIKKIANETEAKIFFKHLRFQNDIRDGLRTYDIELLDKELENINVFCFKDENIVGDTIVQILYTSGTTGDPKGVILTHKNLISNINAVDKIIPISPSDKFLSILPLSHIFEQTVGFLLPFKNTAEIIYAHSPTAIPRLLKEHEITKMAAVPEFLSVVMSRIETTIREQGKEKLFSTLMAMSEKIGFKPIQRLLFRSVHKKLGGRLRTIASGGAALDVELEKKWEALGVDLLQGYGLTETSPIVSANTYKDRLLGSVGKAVPGVSIKIAKNGEILVKGPGVFSGYYKDREKTTGAFTADGWFKTDDIGNFDEDKFLFIKGRKKYMIKGPGAQNVYPEDIEFELNKLPDVEDSCVVGIQKENTNFEIHAVLLGDIKNPAAVIEKANRNLASYQHVTGWSIWPHEDFPRSATLKVKREEVISWLKEKKHEYALKTEEVVRKTPLIRLLADVTEIPASQINTDTKIVSALNLDSLLRVELVARIEEKFGATISEARIDLETNVADLQEMIGVKREPAEKLRLKKWTLWWWVSAVRILSQILWIFPLVRTFVKLELRGEENLKNLPLPAIIMPTHASHLDSLVLIMALPFRLRRKIAYAAAKDVIYETYRHWSFGMELFFNVFPFPRTEKENIKIGIDYIGRLLDREWSVVVYPEGQMSESGKLLPLKQGTGLVAVEMGVPVVPVKIVGSREIVPYAKFTPRRRGTVTITFGKPLMFTKKDSYAEALEKIEKNLHNL